MLQFIDQTEYKIYIIHIRPRNMQKEKEAEAATVNVWCIHQGSTVLEYVHLATYGAAFKALVDFESIW